MYFRVISLILLRILCFQRIPCNSEQITNFKRRGKEKINKKRYIKDKEETIKMETSIKSHISGMTTVYVRERFSRWFSTEGNTLRFRCIFCFFKERNPLFSLHPALLFPKRWAPGAALAAEESPALGFCPSRVPEYSCHPAPHLQSCQPCSWLSNTLSSLPSLTRNKLFP